MLGLVFLHLPTRTDRAFFPAVCRTWCSAARESQLPPPSPVPWLVLPSGSVTSLPRGETFLLPEGVHYHTSYGEWLLLTWRDDGSCFLMNPFTRATMPLRSLSSYSYYEQPVEFGDDVFSYIHNPGTWMDNMHKEMSVLSLVVCSTRLIAAIVVVGDLGAIALCRPGAAAWSVSKHDECSWLSHMVFFQGKLYALDANNGDIEDLISIDIVDEQGSDEPRVSRIECFIQGAYFQSQKHAFCMKYLLESHGSLLMVCRKLSYKIDHCYAYEAGTSEFEVLKADLEQHLWADVRTLGNNQALFLGRGCSKAVCVSPYDLSRDCIFFLDDYISINWRWNKITTSCRVYDMKA
ncbi:hypothetical protein U9M48_005508 [Paspalum notatum var. saurae]|uniref:KIB1-4 beta-propeller domain-containing protein n=1 Tax=Paspalum notatum var. saurae TaxID=547442 RepID=A0AAQ3PXR7_PASNO